MNITLLDPDGKPWAESKWRILPVPKNGELCSCGKGSVYFDGRWDYTSNSHSCPAREFLVAIKNAE